MKICEVLKRISILSKMEEGEKIYLSNSSGYILNNGYLQGFDENKNEIYRSRYTKEQFIDIQYKIAFDILSNIENVHRLLNCIPNTPIINLYDSDIITDNQYDSCKTRIKSISDNHLVLIIHNQPSFIRGFEIRIFDIDIIDFLMKLQILKGNDFSDNIYYHMSSGNLSEKSISIINKEIKGENGQSTLNTSYDMFFENCSSYDDMIEKAKNQMVLKKKAI